MPNKSPLQEIMNNIEGGISGFGLPPLPPLSKLIPSGNKEEPEKEEPEEVKKPKKILEVDEVETHKEDEHIQTDTRWKSGESNMGKVYDGGRGRVTPLPKKSELRIRNVFVRKDEIA